MAIVEPGDENRRVRQIFLLGLRSIYQLDYEAAARGRWIFPAQQCAENRVAVESREAAPGDATLCVDQRPNGAIAD